MAGNAKSFLKKIREEHGLIGLTADIIVLSRENGKLFVLLVRRSDKPWEPFPNQWALPGGFLGENETLEEAARRELREETGVFMPVKFEQVGTFSDPQRDPRGRVIATAFLVFVEREDVQPRAGSDAKEVGWFRVDRLPKPLAFDHDIVLKRALARIQ